MELDQGIIDKLFLTPREAKRNLDHNQQERIKATAIDINGYIVKQSEMGNWRFGSVFADGYGCGAIAIYNALKYLGRRPDLAAIIAYFDKLPLYWGEIAGGMLGSNPRAVRNYFKTLGYHAKATGPTTKIGKIEKRAKNALVNILLYLAVDKNEQRGHYVMFHPVTGGSYRFYNEISDLDIRSLKDFYQSYEGRGCVYCISVYENRDR